MVKKGPPRSLSITVDPSHRLLTDDTDRVRSGRVVLDNGSSQPTFSGLQRARQSSLVPPSPAPQATFNLGRGLVEMKRSISTGARVSTLGPEQLNFSAPVDDTPAKPTAQLSVVDAPPAPLHSSPTAMDAGQPEAASVAVPFVPSPASGSDSVCQAGEQLPLSPLRPSLPPIISFSSTLAARRRSSIVSLPPLPTAPLTNPSKPINVYPLGPRPRNDSVTSLTSVQSTGRRAPSLSKGSGRAEEDGFSYLNSAASTSHSALSNISVPAPYQNGPIQVLPGIWLGCEENARDWDNLRRCNIGSILNVAKEIHNVIGSDAGSVNQTQVPATSSISLAPPPLKVRSLNKSPSAPSFSTSQTQTQAHKAALSRDPPKPVPSFHLADRTTGRPDLHYLHLPWSHGQPDLVANGFPQAMEFVDESVKRGKGVLVHCQCGVSRSATLVIALVMRAASRPDATEELKKVGPTMSGAYEFVKEKSVCVGPNMSLIYQLMEYEKHLAPRNGSRAPSRTDLRRTLSQTSDNTSQSEEQSDSCLSEEERMRSEEEEWARMRRQMEEEEEREREELYRAAAAHSSSQPSSDNDVPRISEPNVPWNHGWNGFSNASSGAVGAPSTLGVNMASRPTHSSVADDEEAKDLDRAMEERLVRRRGSVNSAASSVTSSAAGFAMGATGSSSGVMPGNGATSSSLATWKSRFGQGGKRVRAGSMESNFTGRSISMVSVEEEPENEDAASAACEPTATADQMESVEMNGELALPHNTEERRRKISSTSVTSSSSLRLMAARGAARGRTRTTSATSDQAPVSRSGADSISVSTSRSATSISDAGSEDGDGEGGDQDLSAPPLSANTHSTTGLVSTPITPLSMISVSRSGGVAVIQSTEDDDNDMECDDAEALNIVIQEPTPLVRPIVSIEPQLMNLSSPISPSATFGFGSGGRFGKRADPPPSASAFKLSFGSDLTIPPPSASPFKSSFGLYPAEPPPPSASHSKLSFDYLDAVRPPLFPSSQGVGLGEPSVPFPRKSLATTSIGSVPSKKRKLSSKAIPALETVPSSPPGVPVSSTFTEAANLMDMVTSTTPINSRRLSISSTSSYLSSSSSSIIHSKLSSLKLSKSPSPPAIAEPVVQPEMSTRKRTKSKPALPPLTLSRSPSGAVAFIRSSSTSQKGRSVSSASSASSSSSTQSLRNKLLLNRVGGSGAGNANAPGPSLPTATTPHQTLFIFPPSPSNKTTFDSNLPSGTPSAVMLTTNYGDHTTARPGYPILSPTPTLANFKDRRNSGVSRKSSVSSISSNGGWLGGLPSTPTTACSRVDARGWVGR
ncbi:hypothetical protein FRB99_005395 [Tulasnella sp. 403]|nr:hypothetical protein FRB99_005395 [Tulasnella sp. 403]